MPLDKTVNNKDPLKPGLVYSDELNSVVLRKVCGISRRGQNQVVVL